ncbi:LuxR C-terminal-related transcriptional regulator [Amycolatopsis sp. OK19-0408]|uniref:LuxR C-terminal-related transcriptional regulator n=1 Tax=Amycolatopsis iheyensis TaxID=2945988 RepID=A0A9X2NMT7_9PSEU|nr:helix-turn-helix transcriptional regulator [Amycolatopsis iheyensis]MCR6489770.1 LuxR C-terminal-related transcriptional regulator [Amycolatopsis iheyensis]
MEELLSARLRELLAGIEARPGDPVRLVLTGAHGHGKSTVLNAISRRYHAAGVPVIGRDDLFATTPGAGAAVLLDDAETLTPEAGAALLRLAESTSRLVLTHTPGVAGSVVAMLAGAPAQYLRLTPWSPGDVVRFAGDVLGRQLTWERAVSVQRATSGVPRLVTRCLRGNAVEELIDQLRAELDGLDEPGLAYLVAAGAGSRSDLELLAVALDRPRDEVSAVVERVRAAGLLAADGAVPPVVARAVREHAGVDRRLTVLVRMLEVQLAAGRPVLAIARELLRLGAAGGLVRAGFEAGAAEVVAEDPALAFDLYAAAEHAGSSRIRLAPDWARAAVLSGRLDAALRLGDELLSADEQHTRARGALVVGTVIARRGDLARGAELLRWSADPGAARLADLAAIALGETVEEVLDVPGEPARTYGHVAALLLGGIRESVAGRPETALSTLLGAADSAAATGTGHLLPDSPAVLTALVALHAGEFDLARGVLERAGGGERHTLLLGWTAMLRGDLATAEAHRAAVRRPESRLAPRDELFLHGLELGLARRGGTPEAVRERWRAAYEAVMRQPIDLFALLPLGEMLVAAARLEEGYRVTMHRDRAFALLDRLGAPVLWSVWLHWAAFHAAIVSGDGDTARKALRPLTTASDSGRLAEAFAAAGGQWLAVIEGSIEVAAVLAAAELLGRAGLTWDAARLAGQAAVRATDRAAMVTLLRAAKQFPVGATASATPPTATEPPALTARERDIGRLFVVGHTYKEIGEQLYISGKTVEHHMARIRAKLGVSDRRTLATLLGGMLGDAS